MAICMAGTVCASDNATDAQVSDDIKVSFNDTVYSEDLGCINVELPENTSGNLKATINDVEFYNENISSSVQVPITIPQKAISSIVVNRNTDHLNYHIDMFFNNISILNSNLKVMKIAPNFTTPGFASEILKDDPEGYVSVFFPESANGEVKIYVDGVFLTNLTAQQYMFLNATKFNTLALGSHNVTISYAGDGYYRKFTKTFNFTVVDMLIQIPQNMLLDHDDCISAKILNNRDGIVSVYVDNQLVFKDKLDKYGEFLHCMFDDVTCGEHLLEVQYNASKFSKSKKVLVNVTYDVDIWNYGRFVYGEDSQVVIIVPTDFKKNLIDITIDGVKQADFGIDNSGWIELDVSKLPVGNHTLVFDFKGNQKYYASTLTHNFTIDYQIVVSSFHYYGDSGIASLTLPESANGSLEVYINGKLYKTVNVTDGKAEISINGMIPGKYDLSAKYTGDDFNVTEIDTKYTVYPDIKTPGEMYASQNKFIKILTPKDAKGKVIFNVNGKNITATIKDGVASMPLKDLKPGEYDIDAYYIGENGFNCTEYAFVTVLSNVKIPNVNVIYTNNANVKVYINGKLAKNKYVTFKVSGKTIKAKTTSKGVATLKVTLKPGTYAIQAIYGASKMTKKLTVKHLVSLNTVKVKKSAKKVVLTVKLAKKLKNKVIKFKFNGKTVKAKTNSKGIAKATFKTSALKVGKKITYSATYMKDTVKKTVKVTK
jgi:hypothetical protein